MFSNSAIACGILAGVPVRIFALQNSPMHQVGTARVNEVGATSETEAVKTLHNYNQHREKGVDLLVVQTVVMDS